MILDPVQIAALKFAKGKRGVGYFMEMGLGKSLLTLEEFRRESIEPKRHALSGPCAQFV